MASALLSVLHLLNVDRGTIENKPITQFHVTAESRLAALARLGAQMRLSLLVETGDMKFFQAPVTVTLEGSTVLEVLRMILEGSTRYSIKTDGSLIVVADTDIPNRVLTMNLGPVLWTRASLLSTYLLLVDRVRTASGCPAQGYAYAGGSVLDLVIPPITLPSATFEQVVTRVADASEPSMWVVERGPLSEGCIADPGIRWEVGLYSFSSSFSDCNAAFKESVGPAFVIFHRSQKPQSIDCREPRLPEFMPKLPPPP